MVYAVNRYHHISDSCMAIKVSDEDAYIKDTKDVLSNILILEKEHPNSNWLKGFYYNAAIMRVDTCYERLFRAYLETEKGDGPDLYEDIQGSLSHLFPIESYKDSNFGKVRKRIVNCLKHDVHGVKIKDRENVELLESALKELLAFCSDATLTNRLSRSVLGYK